MFIPSTFLRFVSIRARGFHYVVSLALCVMAGSCDVVSPLDQSPASFIKVIGGAQNEVARKIRRTPDGGYIVVGSVSGGSAQSTDIYLLRIDASGEVEWTKTYGGRKEDDAYDVLVLEDGGFIVVGETANNPNGGADAIMLRLDSQGDSLWMRTFGGFANDRARAVTKANGGGYVMVGESNSRFHSFGAGIDHYLLRVNEAGDTVWQTAVPSSGDESANAVATLDDGYLLGGKAGTKFQFVRVDSVGKTVASLSEITYDVTIVDMTRLDAARFAAYGTFKVVGRTEQLVVMFIELPTRRSIVIDTLATFGNAGVSTAAAGAIARDGSLLAFGTTDGLGHKKDFFLVSVSAVDGSLIWSRSFGGASDDAGQSLVVNPDGSIVMVGTSGSFNDGGSGIDVMLVKTNARGEIGQ